MSFFVELWESVFTPGTTPALITATHVSFILLIISLLVLIFLTKSIHFINLLVIAVLLYASVFWFINELQQVKLKSNDELSKKESENHSKAGKLSADATESSKTTATPEDIKPKKRKV
ncbi:V-type ATPase assembly factor, putative [Candida dubliniensis CD36]|uniref:V-type ATPase assembly factor, putative n=1 Tax=Candida dubliniensis (strain CD36 / ATCC MYA-646 / CBS 7987 / NCPF 3949 / NRRL Y-17841) TaxID=573826 RepID=B9WLE4_CANDC|nr:V-type ATPase assembly factor, putative [Candida dubliniensis CD36]CAX39905.1 V-type ATPase assembly factor, putative [Candida dubliniensis CD36]